MICRKCGAVIKHNEEYCRKCGALVINFKQVENKNLKNLCVENNAKGKWQAFINRISNKEAKAHKVEEANKHNLDINNLGSLVNKYNKVVKNTLSENNSIKGKNINLDKEFSDDIGDIIKNLFKL